MAIHQIMKTSEFDELVIKSEKVVLVDFWAEWCPPCRAMEPILEDLAKSLDTDVDIVKVNVEASAANQKLASDYGVQGIPNMQVFKAGQKIDELVGMRPAAVLKDELQSHI